MSLQNISEHCLNELQGKGSYLLDVTNISDKDRLTLVEILKNDEIEIVTETPSHFLCRKISKWDKLEEKEKRKYYDKVPDLLQDFYCCTKFWKAWRVGTMDEDDFILAAADDDIIVDTAKTLFDIIQEFK